MVAFLRKNSFVLMLLLSFLAVDYLVSLWDPMTVSRRFYKDDFTKTIYHHGGETSGPVFFGNSAVTGAYIEEQAQVKLVEMGLSLGTIEDLKAILQKNLYQVEEQLVIGIDVHTMVDTFPPGVPAKIYPWLKPWYQPYLYAYRDYFMDAGGEFVRNFAKGLLALDADLMFAYEPRWIDKELYFGQRPDEALAERWPFYNEQFGRELADFRRNIAALEWVIEYAEQRDLPLRVIWMPWNPAYPDLDYVAELKAETNRLLAKHGVPVLDLMHRYDPVYFHDLVHLNREKGAPLFTREVDEWLLSLEKSANG